MPRPPLNAFTMEYTVKFRLSADEHRMLTQIARGGPLSSALRQMIHEESKRMKRKGRHEGD